MKLTETTLKMIIYDLITGVETVIERGYIDETQLFVTGGVVAS